ncbi:MAG: MATE family efflux transporter, partial [Clostridia bacterium]|nr:MATE family efflux transporter [Clostridia bacterium]
GIAIGLIGTVIFLLLPGPLLKLFNASEEMLAIGVPAVRILSITFVCCSITTILGMCASGLGNGVINMIGAGIRQVILLLPCFALLLNKYGISRSWYAMWIAEMTAMLYVLFAMHKEINKKAK